MKEQLTHAERDARDHALMAEIRSLPRFGSGPSQVEIATMHRRAWARAYPELRSMFNALPELEKI